MTFDEYLRNITEQVGKHGKAQMKPFHDLKARLMGFRSPDGEFTVGLGAVKTYFATGPWRENTEMVALYEKMGGTTPLSAMTQLPPNPVFMQLVSGAICNAIDAGELLYKAQHDPKRARA